MIINDYAFHGITAQSIKHYIKQAPDKLQPFLTLLSGTCRNMEHLRADIALVTAIYDALSYSKGVTATEVALCVKDDEGLGYTTQRISPVLNKMVYAGLAVRSDERVEFETTKPYYNHEKHEVEAVPTTVPMYVRKFYKAN